MKRFAYSIFFMVVLLTAYLQEMRNKYIKWYIGKYRDPKWDWSGLDIHHVIPLEYGGDNKMGNLYALTRTLHQQEVSPR